MATMTETDNRAISPVNEKEPEVFERKDGRPAFNGHAYPPSADQLVSRMEGMPGYTRPDPSKRSIKERIVGNVWIICSFCCLGGCMFGADIASMSAVLALPSYNNYFGNPDSSLQGGISSSISAGSFGGSLLYMWLGDRLGRRGTLICACCIWIVGAVIQTSTTTVAQLVVGRVISGICVGLASSTVPVYQSEMAPPQIRGRLVSLQQWGIDWGILLGYFVEYGCSFIGDGNSQLNFRIPWILQVIPGLLLMAGMIFVLPESPRWLASQGKYEDSLMVLARVHGAGNPRDPFVLAQYTEIREQIIAENTEELSFLNIFSPKYLKRLFLACSVQMWCQLSGINALMYYIVYIFQSAGLTGTNVNLIASAIQYVCFVCGTVPAIFYMDSWGRRPAWLVGGIAQGASLFIVGGLQAGYGSAATVATNGTTAWIVQGNLGVTIVIIFFSYMFIIFNAMLFGPISWCYPTEVFPLAIRSHGIGMSTATTWAFTFAVTYFTPPALNTITWRTYFVFGTFCFAASIHFWFMFPETRGRPLEEMDVLFESNVPAWKTRRLPTHIQNEITALAESRHNDWSQQVNAADNAKVKPQEQMIERSVV